MQSFATKQIVRCRFSNHLMRLGCRNENIYGLAKVVFVLNADYSIIHLSRLAIERCVHEFMAGHTLPSACSSYGHHY